MRPTIVAFLITGLLSCLADTASAEPEGASVTTPQAAVVRFATGARWQGTLHGLNAKEVRFVKRGQRFPEAIRYAAKDIASVQTATDLYTYDAKRQGLVSSREQEAARSGKVKVINNTDREVSFIVTGARNKLGGLHRISLVDDKRSKSNLELAVKDFSRLMRGSSTSSQALEPPLVIGAQRGPTRRTRLGK